METMMKLFVMCILIIAFTTNPFFSKKDIHFGIHIPGSNLNKLKRIYTKFIIWNILFGIIGTYMMLTIQDPLIGAIGVTFGYLGINGIIYILAYKQVKNLKKEMLENKNYRRKRHVRVIDTSFTKEKGKKMRVSPWYFLIPLGIILIVGIISLVNYDKIPDPVPIHYNAVGEVDGWANKSYGTVMMLPMTSLAMTGLFYFIYLMIGKSKQQISSRNPHVSSKQNKKHRKIWSGYGVVSAILMSLFFGYMQLNLLRQPVEKIEEMMFITLGYTFVMIIGTLGLALYTGNGGSKLKVGKEDLEVVEDLLEESDDDQYWKWGSFYYNPNDPSIFVEKRVGIGWTVNMGTLQGKLFLGGTLVFILVVIIMSMIDG